VLEQWAAYRFFSSCDNFRSNSTCGRGRVDPLRTETKPRAEDASTCEPVSPPSRLSSKDSRKVAREAGDQGSQCFLRTLGQARLLASP